jgi:hypothetical protein
MLNEVPNIKDKTLETWRKLGALNISDNKGDSKCLFEIEDGLDFYGSEFSTFYGQKQKNSKDFYAVVRKINTV